MRFLVLIIVAISSLSTFAYTPKEGNITATLGPFFHRSNFESSSTGAQSSVLDGFALLAQGDSNDDGSLEIGMFYMPKLYMRENNRNYVVERTQVMHITMGYRKWWTQTWSTSLSFFSSYSMGNVEITHNDFGPDLEPSTSARDNTEYGFDFSLQKELWVSGKASLVVDGRYSKSVTNKEREQGDHFGFLFGLRYLLQEKIPSKEKK